MKEEVEMSSSKRSAVHATEEKCDLCMFHKETRTVYSSLSVPCISEMKVSKSFCKLFCDISNFLSLPPFFACKHRYTIKIISISMLTSHGCRQYLPFFFSLSFFFKSARPNHYMYQFPFTYNSFT